MRINESMKVIDMLRERREHLRNEGEAGLRASENWCAYAREDVLRPDTMLMIGEPYAVDAETGAELLPARVLDAGLFIAAEAAAVDDAVIDAVRRDSAVSAETLVEALNYYLDNDEFMAL